MPHHPENSPCPIEVRLGTYVLNLDPMRFVDECLTCPLPHCILDKLGQGKGMRNKKRNEKIQQLRASGLTYKAIAKETATSTRTVCRIVNMT